MAGVNQEIIRFNNQEEHDYADTLEPGYRFCPTDSELIVYYLKPKIETGKQHPRCRYYEVNIYDSSPDELTAKPEYRSCENKWYFLTWTEQKHPNGIRPNRQTRNGGTWKASQACAPVQDVTERVVGSKLSLVYLDEKKRKTPWLMQEYTTKNPNIPKENRKHNSDKNKMTDWVLCKIYKKVPNQNANKNLVVKKEAIVEQNHQLEDEPSPRRRRLSMDEKSYESNGPEHVQIQESNHHSGTNVQTVAPAQYMLTSNQQSDLNNVHVGSSQTFPAISMNTSPNLITMQQMPMFCDSNLIQPPFDDTPQAFEIEQVQPSSGSSTFDYYPNQACPSSTESIRFLSGAFSSSSLVLPREEDATAHVAQPDGIMTSLSSTSISDGTPT
ncbi:NAC domain-containing protein [Tanacetum coccineum]